MRYTEVQAHRMTHISQKDIKDYINRGVLKVERTHNSVLIDVTELVEVHKKESK